jgi:aspartokinase-like uncharacterized kinase
MPATVVKIGGSVLSMPDLSSRLSRLLQQFTHHDVLCVVGGGAATDVVREWDRLHHLGEEVAHWLAIESLGLTARLVSHLIPNSVLIRTRGEAADCWKDHRVAIADVPACLQSLTTESCPALPPSWDATSDSISAWIAAVWPADRLVLVKSIDAPRSLEELAPGEDVDAVFPLLAAELPHVLWCNLAGNCEVMSLRPSCRLE